MANEFKHNDPGSTLTQDEYIASDGTGHVFESQATGDILYASSSTVLSRLAKGSDGNVLELASGLPAWTASPTIGSTSWANANHAHAASNSGGTIAITATTGTLAVGNGGSGATSLTDGGILLGSGTAAVTAMSVLADGEIVVGDGSTDPVALAAFSSSTGALKVANGGTGAASLDDKAVLITQDSGTDTVAAAVMDANGELLIGGTSGPAVATLTAGAGIDITNGDGTIEIIGETASDTNPGIVELATAAETTTGTDTGRAVTPDGLAGSVVFGTRYVQMVVVDFTADIAEGNGKFYLHIPAGLNGMDLVEVHAKVITVGSGSTVDVQIHNLTDGSDMLSTSLTIDNGELDSKDAGTAAVINGSEDDVVTNDVLRIDVDGNGGDTTVAKGLIVTLGFRLP
jgi:hypothetical protein